MTLTAEFLAKTNLLKMAPEVSDPTGQFKMFNDAGTEVEVSEFLYSLTKMVKPTNVLETGTHVGVSSSYIAQALKENGKGHVFTCEVHDGLINKAQALWRDLELTDLITLTKVDMVNMEAHINSLLDPQPKMNSVVEGKEFELVFLDSEPQLRFNEFIKYWPLVKSGGFILIHDLHPNLAFTTAVNADHPDTPCWPYGDFRNKLGPFMKRFDVQTVSFPTPRGFTLFQKTRDDFSFTQHLRDQI